VVEVTIRYVGGAAVAIILLLVIIAAAKAVTISLFYQHLRWESFSLGILPLAAVIGVIILAVAAGFSINTM
jgi:hypothetical protein